MTSRVTVHAAVVDAVLMFYAEHSSELLAARLGVHEAQLSTLLHHPVANTKHNRELITRLAEIVGAYVAQRNARRQPIVEQEDAA